LAFAWTGGSATLDGHSVTGNRGFETGDTGTHTLRVAGQPFTEVIEVGDLPEVAFTATPETISPGEQAILEWITLDGAFLDSVIDWYVDTGGLASGSAVVMPADTRSYRFVLITEEGGADEVATVYVDHTSPDAIFADGFESGDVSAWSSSVP
jgi:hypothetical protein